MILAPFLKAEFSKTFARFSFHIIRHFRYQTSPSHFVLFCFCARNIKHNVVLTTSQFCIKMIFWSVSCEPGHRYITYKQHLLKLKRKKKKKKVKKKIVCSYNYEEETCWQHQPILFVVFFLFICILNFSSIFSQMLVTTTKYFNNLKRKNLGLITNMLVIR